ncbi:MAG: DUF3566 domain-containing protein [Actinobacteria bacterium]|nr:DUF3566 domain-containing protein [Actinomycetota bacterium]
MPPRGSRSSSASKTARRSGGNRSGSKSPSGKGKPVNRSGGTANGTKGSSGGAGAASGAAVPAASPSTGSTTPPQPATAPPRSREATTSQRSGPRTTRLVVRHIDPRSALRVSALFYLSLSVALFVAATLLWLGANAIGLVGNIEAFMDEVGFTDFQLRAGQFLKASLITAVVFTVAGSLANFLMAVLYNLISETVGGVSVVLGDDRPHQKS